MATYPTVEMYLNSAWTDITSYVYYRDMIEITRGQSGEGARTDTSSCRMTLDNRDGRWSPRNPTGPYYGQLTRNVPIRVSIDAGESYLNLTGTSGERVTTPDAAALDITGDIDIRIELTLENWDGGSDSMELAAKFDVTGNNRSWLVYLTGNDQIAYRWSADGTATTEVQSDAIYLPNHVRRAIRITHDVNDGSGNNVVTFYTADSIDGPWTQVSVETTAGTTSIFSSNAEVEIGDIADLLGDNLPGRIHKVKIYNGIAGTLVANPDFTVVTAGASSFVDSTNLTWTKAGAATFSNRKIRFSGEVSSLTIDSDKSGRDATAKLEAAGLMRRLSQGQSPLDSALRRFIKTEDPIECWPLTDGLTSTRGKSLTGGLDMTPVLTDGSIQPEWGVGEMAPGVEPVVALKKETRGTITGRVPNSTSAASAWSVDYFFATAAQGDCGTFSIYDRGANTDADNLVYFQIGCDQGSDELTVFRFSQGDTSSSFALISTVTSPGVFDGQMHHIRFTMDPGGSDSVWTVYIDGVQESTGTLTGIVVKAVSQVSFSWALTTSDPIQKDDTFLGYVTYWDSTGPTAAEMWDAANGFTDERAGDRLDRLTTEESVTYQRIGTSTTTPQMGIQLQDQFMNILRDCETADMGFLYEPREFLALTYRDRESLYNQSARLTLDYASHELSEVLLPVEDDQVIRNDVTVQQTNGAEERQTKDSGTLSTLSPPNGVGRYDESVQVNLYNRNDLPDHAGWRLHLGTVDEARYPQISINLRHSTFTGSTTMMEDALRLNIGDRLVIENPPSWVPPDDITLIAVGFTETFGVKERDIVINCVPESAYHVAELDDTTFGRLDTAGSTLNGAIDSDDTSVSVATTTGPVWVDSAGYASQFPFDVKVGGEVMTVTAITGTTSPQTFTVTRSVNGVTKSHSSGASISLANPVVIAL